MKLYATVKNTRGGKKSTGDDTRILVELSYGNKMLGTVSLYAIVDDKVEGYRVWWEDGKGFDPNAKPILESVKAKRQKGKCTIENCSICEGRKDDTCIFCERNEHHEC